MNQNRRKDDARPAVALQWSDRPDQWTLMLTGPTSGMIGPLGSTWPNQPAEYERVDVCVRRKDGPVVIYRTGGEGAGTWHQFYPCSAYGEPLKDGEYLYREGAAPSLDRIEQYRLQMAAISTAAIGYWKMGDSITPDYDTQPLRDVAALFAKYDALHKFREQVRVMVAMLKNREWAEDLTVTDDAAELQVLLSDLVGRTWTKGQMVPVATVRVFGDTVTLQDASLPIMKHMDGKRLHATLSDIVVAARDPEAMAGADAALQDAMIHGVGVYRMVVEGDRPMTVRVTGFANVGQDEGADVAQARERNRMFAELAAFSPHLPVRDALHPGYVKFNVKEVPGLPPGVAVVSAGDRPGNKVVITGIGQSKDDKQ